jgi:hypothetical protein
MKYLQKRPAATDNEVFVYEFVMGLQELKLLYDIVQHTRKNLIRTNETTIILSRLRNISKEFAKVIYSRNKINN